MANRLDWQIEQIVAESDGSLHDALRALMQVNERLEAELEWLRSTLVSGHVCVDGQSLH
ncbi:hypothetical protein SR870_22175 [Rhodopseudomonas palustris]|uniref:hypothetical protein n=1 Tax=Rhodopseudomonas palustris TaxID=1076 RepID=UPI002ACD313D|nr:hypothetical protein [Rhodopseudomonas palustris]WQG99343.1 hypothetical protein SR870_22175 [Rhodopseudomonas palustris]